MRYKKLTYIAMSAMMVLSISSCKGFLDTVPDTRVEVNSVDAARMLLVDAYPSYNPGIVGELLSDNMEDNNTADYRGTRFNLTPYDRSDEELFCFEDIRSGSSSADYPSGLWEGYYNSIASANAALECLDKVQARIDAGEDVKDARDLPAVRAEALMIRAFSHFMLANIFCEAYRGPELSKSIAGIPYMTKSETTVKPHYDRPDLATVYANIQKDIDEALPMISNNIYDVPKYHFNLQAAYAFAARFYLQLRDYEKVLQYCNRVFGGEGVDPTPYLSDIWSNLDSFYYISDFGLYYMNITQQRNLLLIPTYSQGWRHYIGGLRFAVTRDGKRATIQGPGPTWQKFNWKAGDTGEIFAMHPCFNGSCGVNGKSQYGSYFAGNCCEQFEYTNKIAGIGYTHMTRAELTMEEVVLMRAEAKLFLGDKAGAIEDLKAWDAPRRSTPSAIGSEDKFLDLTEALIRRFYADPGYGIAKPIHLDEVTPSDKYSVNEDILPILQCIQHFRRIEFVHMGTRFFDLKRYGIEWSHKIGVENRIETMSLFDKRRAVQIPPEVVAAGFEPNTRIDDTATENGFVVYAPSNE